MNDPETMAFTGELSKLCWGIVTSDQVLLIIIFEDHHETKVESYLFAKVMVTAVVDHDGEADGDVSLR